ncbi:MAG: ABC1 kinase family protein [Paracoccaceae bacterium]
MADDVPLDEASPGRAVPDGRVARLMRMGSLTAGIGGRVLLDGARQLASGQRPRMQDLLLTPDNARKITQQLAQMRGAAMKMGQLLSMETGDFLPRELTDILSRLRADADHMPPQQLRSVLDKSWGKGWISGFAQFNVRPIASASIGQVHRARTRDGHDLAIKVQYPGVRNSIDSDVSNVAALLRLSGLLPKTLDIRPLMNEARSQLHEEADYIREGTQMDRFVSLLADAPQFRVPRLYAPLSGRDVLAMEFIDSVPIESLRDAPQALRDEVVSHLLDLVMQELFRFRLMQTDPNFANYRYDPDARQIVLLDFGATRGFSQDFADGFQDLLRAALAGDLEAMRLAAMRVGYFDAGMMVEDQRSVMRMAELAIIPMQRADAHDFGDPTLPNQMRKIGMEIGLNRDLWHVPPADVLFMNRKFGGLYLLATMLKARVDIRSILQRYA